MKRTLIQVALLVALALSLVSVTAMGQGHRRGAAGVCKERYRAAIRGARYLRGHDRRIRIAEAKRERRECLALSRR